MITVTFFATVYIIHSAALLQTLDALWQVMFLQDIGRSYIDKWFPYLSGWHDSTSPKDTFHTKQILQYLNVSSISYQIRPLPFNI